jgi:hypothetical protein
VKGSTSAVTPPGSQAGDGARADAAWNSREERSRQNAAGGLRPASILIAAMTVARQHGRSLLITPALTSAESTRGAKELAGSRVLPRDVPDAASARASSPASLARAVSTAREPRTGDLLPEAHSGYVPIENA